MGTREEGDRECNRFVAMKPARERVEAREGDGRDEQRRGTVS